MNYAVLFVQITPSDNLRPLNRQTVSSKLKSLVPNEINYVRVNLRKNAFAVGGVHQASLISLNSIRDLDNIKVQAHIPLSKDMVLGVIYDVDVTIPYADLPMLIKAVSTLTYIVQISRLGKSRSVNIIFRDDTLPCPVKIRHFRHVARPFTSKPLQCVSVRKWVVCAVFAVTWLFAPDMQSPIKQNSAEQLL